MRRLLQCGPYTGCHCNAINGRIHSFITSQKLWWRNTEISIKNLKTSVRQSVNLHICFCSVWSINKTTCHILRKNLLTPHFNSSSTFYIWLCTKITQDELLTLNDNTSVVDLGIKFPLKIFNSNFNHELKSKTFLHQGWFTLGDIVLYIGNCGFHFRGKCIALPIWKDLIWVEE
jgi:hypothetical protein